MSFLNPITALIAAGITVPLLVSLYFLKLRRKPIAVPSTLLWKRAIQDLQVNAPFQRIRNNLLLWLQLLLLALLLIAMARPTQRATVSPGERVVIVIDHSASMNANDAPGNTTRLEEAKSRAIELIDALGTEGSASGGGAMVVSFAERAAVVQSFTNDRGLLRRAVRGIEATDQRSRIEPALGLIVPHTSAVDAADAEALTVYVFSDGKVHRDGVEELALPGATLAFERIGGGVSAGAGDRNIGIVSASARRDYEVPSRVSVFARLTHTGALPTKANVTLKVDGRAVRTRAVSLPAASPPETNDQGEVVQGAPADASVTFEVSLSGAATLEVVQDQRDTLAADDSARLQLLPAQRLSVLLVTEGNRYLREAIRAAGAKRLELITPERYEATPPEVLRDGDPGDPNVEGFDVIVFDRYSPKEIPGVSSLSFGATVPIEGLTVRPSAEDAPSMQAVLTWSRDHPLMRYVVLDDVTLRRPGRLTVPLRAKVLAVGLAGPLIAEVPPGTPGSYASDGAEVNVSTGTHVAVSFDVLESRWPHHWSFQVFMVNALETLGLGGNVGAGEAALAFRTGESATVEVPPGMNVVGYSGPERLSATARAGRASLPAFAKVGWYEPDESVGGAVGGGLSSAAADGRLAVNLLDPLESDVRPVDRLEVGTSVAQATSEASLIRKEVWPWFAWGALGLLLVEWVVYTRRMRV